MLASKINRVARSERGWAGHFICALDCLFRRNTLLVCGDIFVVVSTVGAMRSPISRRFETVGYEHYYETMAFYSKKDDIRYHDADVTREVQFDSPWQVNKLDSDDEANAMHEAVVAELTKKLRQGGNFG